MSMRWPAEEQPPNYRLIKILLTNMGFGDKAAAFEQVERAMAQVPIEKDALEGPDPIEILARVAAQMLDPLRNDSRFQKLAAPDAPKP